MPRPPSAAALLLPSPPSAEPAGLVAVDWEPEPDRTHGAAAAGEVPLAREAGRLVGCRCLWLRGRAPLGLSLKGLLLLLWCFPDGGESGEPILYTQEHDCCYLRGHAFGPGSRHMPWTLSMLVA